MNRQEFFSRLHGTRSSDMREIHHAYWLGKEAHRLQKRDGGRRYFEHPREVALQLIDRGFTRKTAVIKGLLHDVLEDTDTPFEAIVDSFGHDMWHSLYTLSKKICVFDPVTGKIVDRWNKSESEYYAGVAAASEEDRLVKCADRTVNLRDMSTWEIGRQKKYAEKTDQYMLPIAKATDPWFYNTIKAEVERVMALTAL